MFGRQKDLSEIDQTKETYSEYDSEKIESGRHQNPPTYANDEEHDLQEGTRRGLSARHIQMISLGGAIGTGLFLNSGGNIATAGPAGALIAYCSVTIATELAAAATIIEYWKTVMPAPVWSTIFMLLIMALNLIGVRFYGELEYWFAMIKILIVIVFIIIGICVSSGGLGGQVIGFKYYHEPGAFVDGAVGTISVLLSAGFSFQGTEVVGITAGEAKNPTKTVPRAIRNTFWRIIIFYICTIFLLGICIPNDYPSLTGGDGSAATASFTIVFELAGIDAGAHVINAVVLTSVLSAANSSVYTCARTLLGLSRDNNAPAFLSRVNRYGSPYMAVIFSSIIGFACVFISIYSASEAFVWFLSITAVSGFISWAGIGFVHVRFRRAYVHQGRDIKELPYLALAYPYTGIFSCVLCVLIVLGQGYGAFTPEFDAVKFVTNYLGIVPFFLCYFIHKIVRRTKIVPLDEVDFETNRVSRFEVEQDEDEEKRRTVWQRIMDIFI
ncbi:amino acid permease-domain-containing protein [Phycomyces nitens]|nr:amino acid permease-domain-containing protein [Phycomyces nitens]